MKIEELTKRVDELYDKLENPKFKEKIYSGVLEKKYKNTSQKYRLIAKILKDDFSLYDISEITIWRLLKVKEKSPDLYKKISRGEIKIKTAYNEVFPKDSSHGKFSENIYKFSRGEDKIDFHDILCRAEELNEILYSWKEKKTDSISEEIILKIDGELYKTRKLLQEILKYYAEQ